MLSDMGEQAEDQISLEAMMRELKDKMIRMEEETIELKSKVEMLTARIERCEAKEKMPRSRLWRGSRLWR